MEILDLKQGTQEWLDARKNYFTASEAQAMMGASPYKTRSKLLREKAFDLTEDNSGKEFLFQRGHDAEAEARPIIERDLGEELFPCTAINGRYLASFDGITAGECTVWEHKLWNQKLAESVGCREIPETHYWQLEHQLLVSGADYCWFTVSDGTASKMVSTKYHSVPERRSMLIHGWNEFERDLEELKNKGMPEPTMDKKKSSSSPGELPSLKIELNGQVSSSNLSEFKSHALSVIDRINTDLKSDDDFANAEQTVKWCKGVEDALKKAKIDALEQTASINDLFKAIDEIAEEARQKRLGLDKLVKEKKSHLKQRMINEAKQKLLSRIEDMNKTLDGFSLPDMATGLHEAAKNKKTISSMEDALSEQVSREVFNYSVVRDMMQKNIDYYRKKEKYHFLFADIEGLISKHPDDFINQIDARILKHEAEDKKVEKEPEPKKQTEPEEWVFCIDFGVKEKTEEEAYKVLLSFLNKAPKTKIKVL